MVASDLYSKLTVFQSLNLILELESQIQ
jgi:hypothetical protein